MIPPTARAEAPSGPAGIAAARAAAAAARTWHGGWALAFAALAGLWLLLGRAPPTGGELGALALVALPGAAGAAGLAAEAGEGALLGVWAGASLGAVTLAGGLAAPLAPVLAGPALAALALGVAPRRAALWAVGVVLAALALAAAFGAPAAVVAAAPGLRGAALLIVSVAAVLALRRPAASGRVEAVAPAPAPDPVPDPAPDPIPGLRAELAAANAARAQAEAQAEGRSRFIAQMSHELRTPLNAIQGFSDIMRTRLFGPIPDRYGEYAELIHESGRHLTELINDVLDLSKIEADRYELRRERFDAREAVNDAMRLVRVQAEEKGVALRALLTTAPIAIDADRRAIKQIVLNLVSNALKFTPSGGSVDVTTRAAADMLEIAVSDTGVGIAADELARLGQPYAQAQAGREGGQGTGLGLSLVKAFAGLHGGGFFLESREGEGACATVRMPVLAPDTAD